MASLVSDSAKGRPRYYVDLAIASTGIIGVGFLKTGQQGDATLQGYLVVSTLVAANPEANAVGYERVNLTAGNITSAVVAHIWNAIATDTAMGSPATGQTYTKAFWFYDPGSHAASDRSFDSTKVVLGLTDVAVGTDGNPVVLTAPNFLRATD